MQSRSMLMKEHRLIEQVTGPIRQTVDAIESGQTIEPALIDDLVDFVRVYADRVHHGKEEDILFAELARRSLTEEDQKLMEELVSEHQRSRRATAALVAANRRYAAGEPDAVLDIAANLRELLEIYPQHIAKEDTDFFPAARGYFTTQQDQQLMERYQEFDRQVIHDYYQERMERLLGG